MSEKNFLFTGDNELMNHLKSFGNSEETRLFEKLVILLSKINASGENRIFGQKGYLDDTFPVDNVWICGGGCNGSFNQIEKMNGVFSILR